jgi:hypothetical protein
MADNITVKWLEVTGLTGNGMNGATYENLYKDNKQKSILDFGNVQAGKTTAIKCVVANFNGVSQVSDLQFWLDGISGDKSSTNKELSTANGWNFYYCIVPKDRLNFGIEPDSFSEAQKKGETIQNNQMSYLDESNTFYMAPIERDPNMVSINQFPSLSNDNKPLVIELEDSSATLGSRSNDSHLIMLSVQTPANANSGTTEGWYYRMNFLYN